MLIDLADMPISEAIRRLSAERLSGDLQVRSKQVVKMAFFDKGRLVFAASNLKKERLGEALVALGRITDDDFNRTSALMREAPRTRFGDALVQAGVMDKKEVGHSVARCVERIALSLFDLQAGAAFFEERTCSIPLEYMVSLAVQRILHAGIRTMTKAELVLTGIRDVNRTVTLAAVPPFSFEIDKCSPEEIELLDRAKARITVRRLASTADGLSFTRLRSVYAFLASGILEDPNERARHSVPQPTVQMETNGFLLSSLPRKPEPTERDAIRQEVDDEVARAQKVDDATWLQVSSSAPRAELVRALEGKIARYETLRSAVPDDSELKAKIELITGKALAALHLARQPVATQPVATQPPTTQPSATSAEPVPAAAPQPVAPAPESPNQSMELEHLLMEGSVRMTVSDFANAVQTYSKVVSLQPNVAAYRLRLAVAMARWTRTARQAEREFLEAVRLEPEDPELHVQFGLYYKAMNVRSRAVAEFRTAVRLNPRHKAARAALEALSPRDPALTGLRKLLE
jgi:tetratricopeptide (TPR) repeat protein